MDTIERWLSRLKNNPSEALWALFWAVVLWIATDLASEDSHIRGVIRRFKNRLAENSIKELRERIITQERFRDAVATYLTSDKALYLHIFGLIFFLFIVLFAGNVIADIGNTFDEGSGHIAVDGFYIVGCILAGYGIRLATLSTRPKVAELIAELDKEIAELKAKLKAKTAL